jgi:hypothetical protein
MTAPASSDCGSEGYGFEPRRPPHLPARMTGTQRHQAAWSGIKIAAQIATVRRRGDPQGAGSALPLRCRRGRSHGGCRVVTPPRHRARARASAVACAIFLLAVGATPALAAISGSLAPPSAQPGEWVELTTDAGGGNPNGYAAIAAAGPLRVYLQRADPNSAGNSCDTRIGDMTWAGGVATLRFQVPTVPAGTYWIVADVQGGCWRFGEGAGVLTLTVLPAGDAAPPPILLAAAVAVAAALIVVVLLIRRRRLLD